MPTLVKSFKQHWFAVCHFLSFSPWNWSLPVVYVSLVNSKHFTYAIESLNRNKNVIVDKPLCLKLNETKKLINTAKKKKLLVAEALVFAYHQQFKLIQSIIKKKNIKLNNIIMQFCIPKLNLEMFLYSCLYCKSKTHL